MFNSLTKSDVTLFMKWIKVKDILPKNLEEVLLLDRRQGMYIGNYYEHSKSFIGSVDGLKLQEVRYWMPLPEVPYDMILISKDIE